MKVISTRKTQQLVAPLSSGTDTSAQFQSASQYLLHMNSLMCCQSTYYAKPKMVGESSLLMLMKVMVHIICAMCYPELRLLLLNSLLRCGNILFLLYSTRFLGLFCGIYVQQTLIQFPDLQICSFIIVFSLFTQYNLGFGPSLFIMNISVLKFSLMKYIVHYKKV